MDKLNPPKYNVMYHLNDHDLIDSAIYKDSDFDTFKDAIEHRNWLFGHKFNIIECWIERIKDNSQVGTRLKRNAHNNTSA